MWSLEIAWPGPCREAVAPWGCRLPHTHPQAVTGGRGSQRDCWEDTASRGVWPCGAQAGMGEGDNGSQGLIKALGFRCRSRSHAHAHARMLETKGTEGDPRRWSGQKPLQFPHITAVKRELCKVLYLQLSSSLSGGNKSNRTPQAGGAPAV